MASRSGGEGKQRRGACPCRAVPCPPYVPASRSCCFRLASGGPPVPGTQGLLRLASGASSISGHSLPGAGLENPHWFRPQGCAAGASGLSAHMTALAGGFPCWNVDVDFLGQSFPGHAEVRCVWRSAGSSVADWKAVASPDAAGALRGFPPPFRDKLSFPGAHGGRVAILPGSLPPFPRPLPMWHRVPRVSSGGRGSQG